MIGTQVNLVVTQTKSSGSTQALSASNVTITDPGAEFDIPNTIFADFTDTGLTFQWLLANWNSEELTFTWTDSTPGAFTGLQLATNNFPAPNANNSLPSTPSVFTNDGTVISFSAFSHTTHYATTNFTATFTGVTASSSAPEPSSLVLLGVAAAALVGRRARLRR